MNMLLNVANCTLIFLKTIKFPRTNEYDFVKDEIVCRLKLQTFPLHETNFRL